MKPKLIFIILFIIFSFYGCQKVYYLNDDERAIINAYNSCDQFKLLKNDTDTVSITVTEKNITLTDRRLSNINYEKGVLRFCYSDQVEFCADHSIGYFEIINSIHNDPSTYYFFKYFNKYTIKTSITINNIFYDKIYFFQGNSDPSDTMYYSATKGVVYISLSDGTTYKLIE